jgi:hydrogenase nickel incorporation protein HypA/HybF
MHELGMAQEIATRVISEAEKMNAKSVVAVELDLGDLSFLDPSNMETWIREGLRESIGKDATIKIDILRSRVTCKACGFEGHPNLPEGHDHHLAPPPPECPRCGSSDVKLEGQRDCILKRIELEV